jgi:hypothetical protein
MNTYRFTLIVEGADLQETDRLEALFGAGCDDATVGRVGGVQYLDFDREADSLSTAVLGALRAIEAADPALRVVAVEPDDLVTMTEIAQRTGRTRESVRLLVRGDRGPGRFPAPATHFRTRQPMWKWQTVAAWFAEALGEPQSSEDPSAARFITAFNAALSWRRAKEKIPEAEREAIDQIAHQG